MCKQRNLCKRGNNPQRRTGKQRRHGKHVEKWRGLDKVIRGEEDMRIRDRVERFGIKGGRV